MSGILYIVATPIGNLEDITLRALKVLAQVDLIAAEDTRHSKRLLQHYAIDTACISLHEHNEQQRLQMLLERLASGQSIALISDAGTPLISDPGFRVVQSVQAAGFVVSPVPGASAVIAALSASGLPTNECLFVGFLPSKGAERQKHIEQLVPVSATIVLYESVHRIVDLMQRLVNAFGPEREAVIARELTKAFETIRRAPLGELQTWLVEQQQVKGEFVVLLHGMEAQEQGVDWRQVDEALQLLMQEVPTKKAASMVSKLMGVPKNQLYERALSLKEGME